jgi:hypothetical protein
MRMKKKDILKILTKMPVLLAICTAFLGNTNTNCQNSGYLKGDFHQHSTYTDGSYSIDTVLKSNHKFGLDWWANSEHGGGFNRHGKFSGLDLGINTYWDSFLPNPIIGTLSMSSGHQNMWRWQSIRDYSFNDILAIRALYPNKMVFQALEWNMPGHEHCSMGIIDNQFGTNPNVNPVAEFEYKFDASDLDLLGGASQGWIKSTNGNNHTKTLEAIAWVQQNYPYSSWIIPAHPERKGMNNIAGFRDMNNAGPTVCFGFESMPGHQKGPDRGEYKTAYNTYGRTTYGGCGIYAAKVGGVWDALLSEGRAWWLFASSDFHSDSPDFWPGEYQKTYTYITDKTNPQSYVDGLRSGNSFIVNGDLIDSLIFEIAPQNNTSNLVAKMGQTLPVCGQTRVLHIKVRDPQGINNNIYSSYNNPELNHIDVICGRVKGKIQPNDPNYNEPSVSTTKVIARFDSNGGITDNNGLTSTKWVDLGNGWKQMSLVLNNYSDTMYYRLRGTNHGLNVQNETDENGNPLSDSLMYPNTPAKAFADLWFYSNPIFVASNINDSIATAQYVQNQSVLGNTKIAVATDLHYMDPSLLINDGVAFQTYLAYDRKLIKESHAIMQELSEKIYNERPEILLIPGDLTKDGEKISHQNLTQFLSYIESNGVTKVYVAPGNHDINNVHAYSYNGSIINKVDSVSPSDFKTIYSQFGYAEASKTDTVSLSYLAKPKQKLWVLSIDACSYDSNMILNKPVTESGLKLSTYKWVLDRLKEARDSGAVVLGMMHHGLTEHYVGQSALFPEYVIKGWDTISANFTKAGLKMMFTGHYHANDITRRSVQGNTSFVYDIETGSVVTWPCPYRVMQLNGDSILNVATNYITNINYNTNGLPFQNYAENFLTQGLTGIVSYQLQMPPYSLDATTAGIVTPHIVDAFKSHYKGDETIPPSEQAFLNYLNSVGQTTLSSTIASLRTDLDPMDNNVVLPLRNAVDSMLLTLNNYNSNDYTTPSWTLFLKAKMALNKNRDSLSLVNMNSAISNLKPFTMPYNITVNINKDPKTRMGFNWFTNAGVTGGKVQIVQGIVNDTNAFNNPMFEVIARCDSAKNLNYSVSANNLSSLAGIPNNTKKSYMFNKATVNGLTPNTFYSYRVGKNGSWSEIGTFKTAVSGKESFSFVYTTDPQANTDEMFEISRKTTNAANNMYPNADFWLHCGDMVETSGASNSEWEWEQFFETQRNILMNKPFNSVIGNHDRSTNQNFALHFNNDSVAFDYAKATYKGSVYSFVYGDALFMAINSEDYNTAGYLDSTAVWLSKQVKANPDVKWRIIFYHKAIYTGSSSHQSDSDAKTFRTKMAPVLDSLKIDLAFQGHDHVYEVIGPVKYMSLVTNSVTNQQIVPVTVRDNLTGLLGGTFDSKRGTIYFLNNSAGKKKYEPRNEAQMNAAFSAHGVPNYFSLFTGRFGQTGEPTFSNVIVSTDTIFITTYTVNDQGVASLFDSFKIIKNTLDNQWTGNVNTNWNKASNWTEGVIPTLSQNVIIPSNASNMPVIDLPAICNDITLESNAQLIQNSNLTIKGKAYAKRDLTANQWHFISSPVGDATGYTFSSSNPVNSGNTLYLQKYNESWINNPGTSPWVDITTGWQEIMSAGKGYEVWSNNNATIKFEGSYFNHNNVIAPVTYTNSATYPGYNLIGNPYPSAININGFNTWGNNMDASIWIWNGSNYIASNGLIGDFSTIASNQAFMVKANNSGIPSLIIPASAKTFGGAFYKSSVSDLLKLKVVGNNFEDITYINFNSNATKGYDGQFDVEKLFGISDAPQLYTLIPNKNLSINTFPELNENVVVPLALQVGKSGLYSISADEINSFNNNTEIILEDKLTKSFIDMKKQNIYSFYANPSDNSYRFNVLFGKLNNNNGINNENDVLIYANENKIYIKNQGNSIIEEVVIMNLLGQEIMRQKVSNNTVNTLELNESSAYYLVKVITSSNTISKKVFIK